MRQRAALLRTYLCGNRVALLDEPFSALDTITKASMQEWFLEVMDELKMSTIFITHDIDEAILLSDRIIMMSSHPGRVNQQISVPFERPRNRAELVQTREYSEFRNLLLSLFYSDIASKIGGDEVVL
jgi:NitT/TauT family transport system ATP-binding protein